jgi:hypothetical protein
VADDKIPSPGDFARFTDLLIGGFRAADFCLASVAHADYFAVQQQYEHDWG